MGSKLAWAEAWPTVFGKIAQKYYQPYLTNVQGTCDEYYHAYNFYSEIGFYIEQAETSKGEGCEHSIIGVLYDLFDTNCDEFDTVSLSYKNWFDVTTERSAVTGNVPTTFSTFIDNLYAKYPSFKYKIGENLTKYAMAPSSPRLVNSVYSGVTPTFTWDIQGGSTRFPNTKFSLIFTDAYNNQLFRKDNLTLNLSNYPSSTFTYTLTTSEWNNIYFASGNTYKVAVAAMPTDTSISEGYVSGFRTFSKTTTVSTYNIVAGNNYSEYLDYYTAGSAHEYKFTFGIDNAQTFQTFGTVDTKMELYDSKDRLIAQSDDSGYNTNSLISNFLYANETYTLRVYFYSSTKTGNIRLSVIPTNSIYTDFTNIDTLSYYSTYFGQYGYRTIGSSLIYRFTPTVTGTYDICTYNVAGGSCVDGYLYVVDVSSNASITSAWYDDDSAGADHALVTGNLVSGKTYLLVVSTCDALTDIGLIGVKVTLLG